MELILTKFCEICQNASENGMIDDPRTGYDCIETSCGFEFKEGLDCNFPKVCGNCKNYSVQII